MNIIDMQDAVQQWKKAKSKLTLVAFMDSRDYVVKYVCKLP